MLNTINIKGDMRKVKTFLHVFINSLFPFAWYYKKILKTRFSFSFKYVITLIMILHSIFAMIFFVKNVIMNKSLHELNDKLLEMVNNYPSDLVIRIKNKQLTMNYDHPYIMWFDIKKFPTPVLVVDAFAQAEKINEYGSYILLHSDAITIRNPNNDQIKTYPLHESSEYVITKNRVRNMQNIVFDTSAVRLTTIILAGYIGINIILLISFIILKIIYFMLFSAVIFFVIRNSIKNTHIGYKKIVQISFHASTLPLIFEYIVITSKIRFSLEKGGFSIGQLGLLMWFFSIVYGAFLTVGIYETYHKETKHIHHHS